MLQPLRQGMVRLYYLDRSKIKLSRIWLDILDPDELTVYHRYKFDAKKEEFLAGRVVLKTILAYYTSGQPGEIDFEKADHGKLKLTDRCQAVLEAPIQFNLSHSGQMVVAGFILEDEIGVDVEQIERESGIEEIAARFFAPGEIEQLAQALPEVRRETAYQIWTRKEAYLKAKGEGLSGNLDGFDITIPDPSLFWHYQILSFEYALAVTVLRRPGLNYGITLHNVADLELGF